MHLWTTRLSSYYRGIPGDNNGTKVAMVTSILLFLRAICFPSFRAQASVAVLQPKFKKLG